MTEVMNPEYIKYKLQFNFKNPKTIDLKVYERRYRNDQKAYEMMLNLTSHQGNANENHSDMPLYSHQKG